MIVGFFLILENCLPGKINSDQNLMQSYSVVGTEIKEVAILVLDKLQSIGG